MPHIPFLLAFGFGNLAMLGWLGAAAAPLLIHLWSRQQYREVAVGSDAVLARSDAQELAEASTAAVAADRDSHVDHRSWSCSLSPSPMVSNFWPAVARLQVTESW